MMLHFVLKIIVMQAFQILENEDRGVVIDTESDKELDYMKAVMKSKM